MFCTPSDAPHPVTSTTFRERRRPRLIAARGRGISSWRSIPATQCPQRDLPVGGPSGRSCRTHARAREALEQTAYDYVAGGAGAEETMRPRVEAFRRRALRPRMLCSAPRSATSPLRRSVSTRRRRGPFSIVHADAERAVAGASKATGVPGAALRRRPSRTSRRSTRHAGSSSTGGVTRSSRRASSGGPRRPATARIRPHRRHADAGGRATSGTAICRSSRARQLLLRRGARPARVATRGEPRHRLADGPLGVPEPRAHVDDLARLRGWTSLPILLKGVVLGDDADARSSTVSTGLLSHRGRQDGSVAALDALRCARRALTRSC